MSGKALPVELVHAILGDIALPLVYGATPSSEEVDAVKRTLLKCSLVSHTWRAIALPLAYLRMHKRIYDYDESIHSGGLTWPEFLSFVEAYKDLQKSTSVLRVTYDPALERLDTVDEEPVPRRSSIDLISLLSMLRHFANLKHLILEIRNVVLPYDFDPETMHVPKSIEHVEFSSTQMFTYSQHPELSEYYLILGSFRDVHVITFDNIMFQKPKHSLADEAHPAEFPRFEDTTRLYIRRSENTVYPLLEFAALVEGSCLPLLSHLHIAYLQPESGFVLGSFLTFTEYDLETLSLEYDYNNWYLHELSEYLDWGKCDLLTTLCFVIDLEISYDMNVDEHPWLHVKGLLEYLVEKEPPELEHVVFKYTEVNLDEDGFAVQDAWLGDVEELLVRVAPLQKVSFVPTPRMGRATFDEQDRAKIAAAMPELAQRNMLSFEPVDPTI